MCPNVPALSWYFVGAWGLQSELVCSSSDTHFSLSGGSRWKGQNCTVVKLQLWKPLYPGPVWTRLITLHLQETYSHFRHDKLRHTETQSLGAGELAQSVKCVLFKREFDLQSLCERLEIVAHACSVNAWEAEIGGLWASLQTAKHTWPGPGQ